MENSALYELFIIIIPKTFLPYHLRGNMRLTGKVIVWHQGKGSTQPLMVTIKVPRVHQPTLRTYVDNVFCSISCLVLTGGSCPMHWRRRLSSWTNAFLLVLTSQRLCRGTCLNALASCGWSQNAAYSPRLSWRAQSSGILLPLTPRGQPASASCTQTVAEKSESILGNVVVEWKVKSVVRNGWGKDLCTQLHQLFLSNRLTHFLHS